MRTYMVVVELIVDEHFLRTSIVLLVNGNNVLEMSCKEYNLFPV